MSDTPSTPEFDEELIRNSFEVFERGRRQSILVLLENWIGDQSIQMPLTLTNTEILFPKTHSPDPVIGKFLTEVYACIDQLLIALVLACDELHSSLATIDDEKERNRTGAVAEIIKCIAIHVYSIRTLSFTGFDVQVKQIVRTYIEYVELLALVCAETEALDQFIASADSDKANSFWHQHLSKSKARKKRLFSSVLKQNLPPETQKQHDEWHEREMRELSESVHPTFNAAFSSGRVFSDPCILPPDLEAVTGSLFYVFTSFADMLEVPTIQYLNSKLKYETNERGKEICNRFYLMITAAVMMGYRKDYLFSDKTRIERDLEVALKDEADRKPPPSA